MFHTYSEALDWIHSRLRLGVKPGLKRMEWMMEKLGHPEDSLKVIHVGGTNGKGSTVTYMRSMLNEAGYSIGTFTSPYIEQFNERISLNGTPISDEDITALANRIKPLADELERTELGSPTEFEVITAMAVLYFAEHHPVDFTIFEVGLGGRFDSTNIIKPLLTVITNIGMDHTQILGGTIEEIAYQKAGIIKQGVPLFTGARKERALIVFDEVAAEQEAVVYRLDRDFTVSETESLRRGERFTLHYGEKRTLEALQISLLGGHQVDNASLAVAGLLYLQAAGLIVLPEEGIRAGLRKAYWPGRLELLCEQPEIIIDGAHNPEGLQAFAEAVQKRYEGKKVKLVFAALGDKDLTEMFNILTNIQADLHVTSFEFPRAATALQLQALSGDGKVVVEEDWRVLLDRLGRSLAENEVLAVTGSLYFIALAKPFLLKLVDKELAK